MKQLITIFFFSLLILLHADELEIRNTITTQTKNLFTQKDFAALNRLEKEYVSTQSRTPGGRWKSRYFHRGLALSFNRKIKTPEFWKNLELDLQKWLNEYPDEPTAQLAYANFLVHKAWMYRGIRYARYVKKEQWKLFYKEIDRAEAYLLKHKQTASFDPQWYVLMLTIARSKSYDKKAFEQLVDEALERYPNYYAIYEFMLYYMSPNWNNFSIEEIEIYAQKVIHYNKGNKEGVYARYYWMANDIIFKNSSLYDSAVDWKRMRISMDELLEKFPAQYNLNHMAHLSCIMEDKEKTRQLLKRIKTVDIKNVWHSKEDYNRCLRFANSEENRTDERSYEVVKLTDIVDHAKENSDKKMLFIHFTSEPAKCQTCSLVLWEKLAKEYKEKVDFVVVSLSPRKLYKYPFLYYRYHLERLPYSVVIYKNKILLRRKGGIDKFYSEFQLRNIIDILLKEKKDKAYMSLFSDMIESDASYFNTEVNTRIYNIQDYKKHYKYKAVAVAVDFKNSKWVAGWANTEPSQEEANAKAMTECEEKRKASTIKQPCKLYMEGDNYCYVKP